MKKTQAIVPAAGSGSRFKSNTPKQFVTIAGKPLIAHTLSSLSKSRLVQSIIVVAPKKHIARFNQLIKKFKLIKVKAVVVGAETRSDSVCNGLKALDADTDIVLVHDGGRPAVSVKIIDESIKLCHNSAAVVAAVPVKPTIKVVDPQSLVVRKTLDRNELWEVQTPQTFKKDILVKAHRKAKNNQATDDASLVEDLGVAVKVCLGDYRNIKVTTKEDIGLVKTFIR